MTARAYLDWNASAPLRPEAREALCAALELTGNPSSVHGEGRAARRLIEQAREQVAALVGAEPRNVIFTSGGTEANVLALSPSIEVRGDKAPRDRLLMSCDRASFGAVGRPVRAAAQSSEIPVDAQGVVDLAALEVGVFGTARGTARAGLASWPQTTRPA